MKAFIRVKNGTPFEHPILEENFRAAFPDIDTEALPSDFAEFFLVDAPDLTYAHLNKNHPDHVSFNGGYTWAWDVTPMTPQEIADKQAQTESAWLASGGPSDWALDVETCLMVPPIPMPTDGKKYRWDFDNRNWIEVS